MPGAAAPEPRADGRQVLEIRGLVMVQVELLIIKKKGSSFYLPAAVKPLE
jgi:hypothetical protein